MPEIFVLLQKQILFDFFFETDAAKYFNMMNETNNVHCRL